MTPSDILTELRKCGAQVVLAGDAVRLRVPAGTVLPAPLMAAAKACRDDLRKLVMAEQHDAYEERAALAEHDGGLSREHAETLAALCTMPTPDGISQELAGTVIDAAARFLDRMRRPA